MILAEKPLFIIHKPHQEITEEDIGMAFRRLAPADKQKFLYLRDNASRPFRYLSDAMAENSFQVHTQGSNLSAHGLFLLLSRFNHSCVPNSKIPTSSGETGGEASAIFAMRDIAAGEEITFCYNPDFSSRTRYERHQLLRFPCNCEACHAGTSQASDMRRTLARGLQYLTLGKDIDGQRWDSTLTFFVDPELRRAAEELTIPLSSRLVYNLLVMALLEEEGLTEFIVETMLPGIQRISKLFATESNAKIVKLAMAQGTWLEKFCVAARLYGREDAADHAIAHALKMVRDSSLKQ